MKTSLKIGTRQSLLALWQSEYIQQRLQERYPDCTVELKKIVTKGDRILDVPLAKIGGKGLFTKEIETELLEGTVDLAVHSLKDMPTVLPEGLCLTVITERANSQDAFVSNRYESFVSLPEGAVVGTSSLRRKGQLLAARPDLQIVDLRGNVDTRLRKLDEGNMDAIILAAAGLERLGYGDRIRERLPYSLCIPAVGQGALAIECREDRHDIRELLSFLHDEPTQQATDGERAFLRLIEGGCQVPIGVRGVVEGERISLTAVIGAVDGSRIIRDTISGPATEAQQLGTTLGERMLAQGGREILAEIMEETK